MVRPWGSPRRSAAGGVHGFPAVLTSFVGRAGPVREVAVLLEQYRLVTVTGPGGAGKTRLAGEVAGQVAGRFEDGVWLAELAMVRDPEQVAAVVAVALGVREQPGVPAAVTLARVLARQQLLLVLDNCEHVLGAAAELCAELVAACDDLRILATSREALRVEGEARYRLGPLAVPDPDDLADAAGAEAVVLFADRARQADAHFVLDGRTGPEVARLVARLDGMPLAIELAAARVEALGVSQLLARLDDRFALLASGDRLAPSRQRSLAATVEWSYQLLDEHERRAFRAVSVFPGPFTLEGAEAVAGTGAGLAVLRLVDCSLLAPPRTGVDGRPRYVMLDTLRAYGASCGPRPASRTRWPRRWPPTRCGWPRRPRRGCSPAPARSPRPGGWMPRTPPCARCWPGPSPATRCSRCGWRTRWAGGGGCAAGWPASTGCWPRWPGGPSRAATGGAPSSAGWAGPRSSRPIWPRRWAICTAVLDAVQDRGPSRVLADALAGRSSLAEHGPARRGGRGWPPLAGHGPGPRLSGRRGDGPAGCSASPHDTAATMTAPFS